ncbi:MAG: hypothetical protein COB38_02760 [Gammaproteobacteria bacterium]|nr:MAG: hypothetical protein COB38_02760 [Gammaproteobacteria bacterium]
MKHYLLVLLFVISACDGIKIQQEKVATLISFEGLMNNGSINHYISVNESIIINDSEKSKKWQVSLGRRDFKLAIIDKYENNSQKSLLFTKIGSYQVKLGSHPSSAQGTIMMQTLTIIVK